MVKKTTSRHTQSQRQSSCRRESFETRLVLCPTQVEELQELLTMLNQATRCAFQRLNDKRLSDKNRLSTKELVGANVFKDGWFASHQESMIGRSALRSYRLAVAHAQNYEHKLRELIEGLDQKIENKHLRMEGLKKEGTEQKKEGPLKAMLRADGVKKTPKAQRQESLERCGQPIIRSSVNRIQGS